MSTFARPASASIAAEPVSPLVAPTIVRCWSLSARKRSNTSPSNCSATSLNASVGPWNSSSSQWRCIQLDERYDRGMGETAIGRRRTARVSCFAGQAVADERGHDPDGDIDIGQPGQIGDLGLGQARPDLGHIKATVGGKPRQRRAAEIEDGRRAPGADITHRARALSERGGRGQGSQA